MRFLPKHITLSRFWRNALTLISGSAAAQAVQLIAMPILSRLYPDSEFGVFGFFLAVISATLVIINGGYELAVMLPDKQVQARRLVQASLWICLTLVILTSALLWGFGATWMDMAQMSRLSPFLWMIPLGLLLEGLAQPLRVGLNRVGRYKTLASANLLRVVTMSAYSVGMGYLEPTFQHLMWGWLIGIGCSFGLIAWDYLRLPDMNWKPLPWADLWDTMRGYLDFPTYGILSAWLNTAAKMMPLYVLSAFFSESVNGQYSQMAKVMNLPIALIALSIGGVFYEHASKAYQTDPKGLSSISMKTLGRLALIGLPYLGIVMAIGPWMFSLVLGPQWELAGEYARIMAPSFYLTFLVAPMSFLIDIRRKLHAWLWLNVTSFGLRFGALWLAHEWGWDDRSTLMLFSGTGVVVGIIQLAYLGWISQVTGADLEMNAED
ncbi:oligosaccharide flippase family protein [Pontibacter sp. G13]|uniref:lipopolysaccharide biosynthesis protein n=1 Tax=Pontibacter sp. G13 TaxID=3074898 RepID=UPI00288C2685|nr:oligosaccharide flippase family protein [Pontibacter sp. G13]WNJ16744.1 oligosaccharide flippase family protein [Pontibacter sp. G13]